MHCSEIRERISYMLDNELSAEESALVTEHVAGCPECMRVFEAFHAVSVAMEELDEVPAGFTEQVMDRVHAAAAVPSKKKPRILRFLATAACFAVILLAGTGIWSAYPNGGGAANDTAQYDDTVNGTLTDNSDNSTHVDKQMQNPDPGFLPQLFADGYEKEDDGLSADGQGFSTATNSKTDADDRDVTDTADGDIAPADVSPAPAPDALTPEALLTFQEAADPALCEGEPLYIVTLPIDEIVLEVYVWIVEDRVICALPDGSMAWYAVGTPDEVMALLEVTEPDTAVDGDTDIPQVTPTPAP